MGFEVGEIAMQTFEDATALTRIGENTFSWRADQRWFQGPGAYGGLTLGCDDSSRGKSVRATA